MSEEATRILNDAIDILNKKGHCKGTLFDPDTSRVCAIGALNLATSGGQDILWAPGDRFRADGRRLGALSEARIEAMDRIREHMPKESSTHYPVGHIPSWNDDPKTSTEDVILAFKKAAASDE